MFIKVYGLAKQGENEDHEPQFIVFPALINLEAREIGRIVPMNKETKECLAEHHSKQLVRYAVDHTNLQTLIHFANDTFYFSKLTFSEILQRLDQNGENIQEIHRAELLDLTE